MCIVFATLGAPERRRLGRAARRADRRVRARRRRRSRPDERRSSTSASRSRGRASARPGSTPPARTSWPPGWRCSTGRCTPSAWSAPIRTLHAVRRARRSPRGSASAPASRSPTGCGPGRASSRAGRTRPGGGDRRRRSAPQARLAARSGAREPALACEELALRARLDLDQERPREAALQLLVALDAAHRRADGRSAMPTCWRRPARRAARPARGRRRGRPGGAGRGAQRRADGDGGVRR